MNEFPLLPAAVPWYNTEMDISQYGTTMAFLLYQYVGQSSFLDEVTLVAQLPLLPVVLISMVSITHGQSQSKNVN